MRLKIEQPRASWARATTNPSVFPFHIMTKLGKSWLLSDVIPSQRHGHQQTKCLQNYSSEFRAKVHGNGATSDNNFGTIVLGNMSSFFILKDSSILSEMTLIEAYFCKKIFMLWANWCWLSSYGMSLPLHTIKLPQTVASLTPGGKQIWNSPYEYRYRKKYKQSASQIKKNKIDMIT